LRKLVVLAVALTAILAISVSMNIELYFEGQSVDTANSEIVQFNQEFGDTVKVWTPGYPFTPPITLYQALTIALKDGDFNATSLQDKTIYCHLYYVEFSKSNGSAYNFFKSEITQPRSNYSPTQHDGVTDRCVWTISITDSIGNSVPNGFYYIDAKTGENVVPGEFLI
jgi:Peptidase propeptide and YPEB domain.